MFVKYFLQIYITVYSVGYCYCSITRAAKRIKVEEGDVAGLATGSFPESIETLSPRTSNVPSAQSSAGASQSDTTHVDPVEKSRVGYIKTNWQKHAEEVQSLKEDSKQLTKMMYYLHKKLDYVKEKQRGLEGKAIPEETIEQFSDGIKILEKIYQQIIKFKQMKLLELGQVETPKSNTNLLTVIISKNHDLQSSTESSSPFSNDVAQVVSEKSWMKVADSMVKELKKVIKNEAFNVWNVRLDDEVDEDIINSEISLDNQKVIIHPQILEITAFNFIDFLVKYKYANPESVRSIFHRDLELAQRVMLYYIQRFRLQFKISPLSNLDIFEFNPISTQHWYWSFLHDSFKVLSKKEKKIIDTVVLTTWMAMIFERITIYMSEYPKFLDLKNSLPDKFLKELQVEVVTKNTEKSNDETEGEFDEEVKKMIDLFVIEGDHIEKRESLDSLLFYLLDHINCYFSPGIIKKVALKHLQPEKYEAFQYKYELAELATQIFDINSNADSYHKLYQQTILFRVNEGSNSMIQKFNKSTFDGFIDRLDVLIPEFIRKIDILHRKNQYLWVQHQLHLDDLAHIYPIWLNILKTNSKTFLAHS